MRHWDPLRHVLLGVTLWGDIATGKVCFQSQYKNNVVMSAKWDWVCSGKSESWRWWYTCTQTPGWIQNLDVQWGEKSVFWCHLEVEGFEVHFMYIQVNNWVHGWFSRLGVVHMFPEFCTYQFWGNPKRFFFYFWIILWVFSLWNPHETSLVHLGVQGV